MLDLHLLTEHLHQRQNKLHNWFTQLVLYDPERGYYIFEEGTLVLFFLKRLCSIEEFTKMNQCNKFQQNDASE